MTVSVADMAGVQPELRDVLGTLDITTANTIAAKAYKVSLQNDTHDLSSGSKAAATSGVNLMAIGTGVADFTLAAPSPGCRCTILCVSRTSGDGVVTAAAGTTLDGVNTIATFNAVNDKLVLIYAGANTWSVVDNTSVTLS